MLNRLGRGGARRTSLAEAPHVEEASAAPAVATVSAESGADTT
jgi:hypothetical protein